MRYGVFDTQDEVWMGNESGPLLNEDHDLVRAIAQIMETAVFGDAAGRYRAMPWPEASTRIKDTIPIKLDALSAVKRAEGE